MRPFGTWQWQQSYLPVVLFALGYFAIRAHYFDYVLIWDSRYYYAALLDAYDKPFDPLNYSGGGGGHNGQLWTFLAGLPNYLFPYSYRAYNAWVALLGTAGVVAFYYIVTALSSRLSVGERLLLTALFAFHPSVFANQVHVTSDTGLLIFWTFFLLALMKEKPLIATIMGCFLLFTKEPAMAHLVVVFIFCALRQPSGLRWIWIKKYDPVVCIPFNLLMIYLLYKMFFRHEALFFYGFLQHSNDYLNWLVRVYPDATLITYALMAFVLNFNWLITCLSAFLTLPLCWTQRVDKRQFLAMAWLLVATLGVVLGVRSYSNLRYLLPVFPAMLLYLSYVLPVIPHKNMRIALLVCILALFGWQNVRSIDPVSNSVFCTTQFGTHRVLAIPDFDKTCTLNETSPWLPGDRLVYNLEFLHIPLLIDAAMKDIRPDNQTVLAVDDNYTYNLFGDTDENYMFTYRNPEVSPKLYSVPPDEQAPLNLPDILYYLEFPVEESRVAKSYLWSHYSAAKETLYSNDGYELKVVKFYHKNRGDWCEPL